MANFSKKNISLILKSLEEIKMLTKARVVLSSDYQGRLICGLGNLSRSKSVMMTSLAAGGYLAMAQLGEFVMETNRPKILVRNGVKLNIGICAVSDKGFVVFVYNKNVNIRKKYKEILVEVWKLKELIEKAEEEESVSAEPLTNIDGKDIIPPTNQVDMMDKEAPNSETDFFRELEQLFGEQTEE